MSLEGSSGAPGGIRTPDQWLRKPLLYPAELRAPGRALCQNRRRARDTRNAEPAERPDTAALPTEPRSGARASAGPLGATSRSCPEGWTIPGSIVTQRMTAAEPRCYPLQHEQAWC